MKYMSEEDITRLAERSVNISKPYFQEGDQEEGNCPDHGKYKLKKVDFGFGKAPAIIGRNCPECTRIYSEAIEDKKDEIREESERRILHERYSKAGVGERYMDSELLSHPQTGEKQSRLVELLESNLNAAIKGSGSFNMILTGSVGTGKTHLCCALIKKLIDANKRAKIIEVAGMIREIKDSWRRKDISEQDVLNYFGYLDMLIIDEIGQQFESETEKLYMSEIINTRYKAMKPTILISNLDIEGIKSIIGERVIDRLRDDGGKAVGVNFKSLR